MAVEWIRNNMLFFNNDRNRQLTETELKVQRSFQKLSIPDCHLKKRSNPPKILNVMPIEYRLPSWKIPTSRRNCTLNSSSSDSIDISLHAKENVHENAKKVVPPITSFKKKIFCQQMLPETEHTRSSTKSSSPKEEILDVNIPIIKFPRKISKTFPKISPSRKIQNINLVLPPGPKIEFPEDFEDMCNDDYNGDDNRETFVLKERPFNVERTTNIEDLRNIDMIIDKRRENRQTNVSFQASQAVTTPLSTPDVKPKIFKYHAKSTPKFSQASEVVTTPLSTPDVKPKIFKYHAKSTPKFSQASEVVTTPLSTPDVKPKIFKYHAKSTPKFSQASEVVTTPLSTPDVKPKIFKYHAKSTPKFSQASEVVTTPLSTPDVEPKFFRYHAKSTPKFSQASEVVPTPLNAPDVKPKFFKLRANSTPKFSQAQLFSSAMIENNQKEKIISPSILEKSLIFENKSMNVSNKSGNIRRSKKISPNLLEKTFIFEKSSTHNSFQESSNSTDLELPLRSKQVNPKKNMVREIVRNLDEKERKSLQHRHSQDDKKKCFVKQIVNALEKRNISRMRSLPPRSSINNEDSPSESETKSYVTSNSPKDTDYSDYGRRSPTLSSDDDQTFNSEYFKEDTLKVKEKGTGDDSVYWISIPRCTVPRSSSLLSVISKLSSHGHSPCISPIKSPNEIEYSIQTSWGATYKTSNPLCKKLFHETVVIDSGYSD
ncbi:nucleolar protein dao-5-like [Bombus affinis]|uniref:nucleolar protein dao-5-like n=1 Tax=Bombus affinis TaxID=309941 RepID=UPI0021B7CC8C|nr:nucleolar protein dao-5-like [Bombus affinis]XP_050575603.1 nucleolar protein dao-5-like [Bombus affinis]XP_050575604.1 nucleolar protein dao-5-like [Bombus affinis]